MVEGGEDGRCGVGFDVDDRRRLSVLPTAVVADDSLGERAYTDGDEYQIGGEPDIGKLGSDFAKEDIVAVYDPSWDV